MQSGVLHLIVSSARENRSVIFSTHFFFSDSQSSTSLSHYGLVQDCPSKKFTFAYLLKVLHNTFSTQSSSGSQVPSDLKIPYHLTSNINLTPLSEWSTILSMTFSLCFGTLSLFACSSYNVLLDSFFLSLSWSIHFLRNPTVDGAFTTLSCNCFLAFHPYIGLQSTRTRHLRREQTFAFYYGPHRTPFLRTQNFRALWSSFKAVLSYQKFFIYCLSVRLPPAYPFQLTPMKILSWCDSLRILRCRIYCQRLVWGWIE